jgi:hypothetical protein
VNTKDFDKVISERITAIQNTLASKGKEYASNTDRLHNFKEGARSEDVHPITALRGMMLKHIVSVKDMCDKYRAGGLESEAMINEKFGDYINYLILLEAMLKEMNQEATGVEQLILDT